MAANRPLRTNTDQVSVDDFSGARGLPISGTLIASGAYQAADPSPAEFTPPFNATALEVVIDITVITGAGNTLTVTIEGFDKASGKWVSLLVSAGLVAVATTKLRISAYATAAGNTVAQENLFETMRVRPVKSGTTTTLTYSIGGHFSA